MAGNREGLSHAPGEYFRWLRATAAQDGAVAGMGTHRVNTIGVAYYRSELVPPVPPRKNPSTPTPVVRAATAPHPGKANSASEDPQVTLSEPADINGEVELIRAVEKSGRRHLFVAPHRMSKSGGTAPIEHLVFV